MKHANDRGTLVAILVEKENSSMEREVPPFPAPRAPPLGWIEWRCCHSSGIRGIRGHANTPTLADADVLNKSSRQKNISNGGSKIFLQFETSILKPGLRDEDYKLKADGPYFGVDKVT